jgi:hypothetical protein
MKRILAVSVLALGLAGCNATVYDTGYRRPHAVIDLQTPAPVYVAPRPAYVERRPRCATIWERTPRGYVERRICGNHIP